MKEMLFKKLIYLLPLILLSACQIKQGMENTITKRQEKIINNQLAENAKLLKQFIAGKIIDQEEPISFTVNKYRDMLHFPTKEDAERFLDACDYLVENWNYEEAVKYEEREEEINHLGSPALRAIDQVLDFNSLRYAYLQQEFKNGIDYHKEMKSYISNPFYQTYFNDKSEIRVGKTIYKYFSENVLAVVESLEENVLDEVRKNGLSTSHKGVGFYNDKTRKRIGGTKQVVSPRSKSCQLSKAIGIADMVGGDYAKINLTTAIFGQIYDGGLAVTGGVCLYKIDINWGDGQVANNVGGTTIDYPHKYNLNLAPGQSQLFTITITANRVTSGGDCNLCTSSETITKQVTINRPANNCFETDQQRSALWKEEWHNGERYKVKCENGQQTGFGFFSNPKIWAKSTFYKRRPNGNYTQAYPPHTLIANVKGVYYTNGCTTPSNWFHVGKDKKWKSVCVHYKPGEEFGSTRDLNSSTRIFTDHRGKLDDNPDKWEELLDWSVYP